MAGNTCKPNSVPLIFIRSDDHLSSPAIADWIMRTTKSCSCTTAGLPHLHVTVQVRGLLPSRFTFDHHILRRR